MIFFYCFCGGPVDVEALGNCPVCPPLNPALPNNIYCTSGLPNRRPKPRNSIFWWGVQKFAEMTSCGLVDHCPPLLIVAVHLLTYFLKTACLCNILVHIGFSPKSVCRPEGNASPFSGAKFYEGQSVISYQGVFQGTSFRFLGDLGSRFRVWRSRL